MEGDIVMYTVLLVDDEPWALEGLQMFVNWEQHGFHVCGICENGAEALVAAQKLKPDVIVTDIRMPQMDGLELIERLQENEDMSATEFVVMSAYSEFKIAKRAMQLGVNNYLLKPIIEEEAKEAFLQIRSRLDKYQFIQEEMVKTQEVLLPLSIVKKLKELLQSIEESDMNQVIQEIDSIFNNHHSQIVELAEIIINSLSIQCSKLIFESGGDPALLQIPNYEPNKGQNADLEYVRVWILSYIEQVVTALKSLRKQKSCTLTEIDTYVTSNYYNPLSIRDVAAKFHLNPVYLGKAYQDRFGCSLIDRMHNLRILMACEKLRETNDSISTIAEQVGYTQYHYFLRHFEQRVGMKPMEYRSKQE